MINSVSMLPRMVPCRLPRLVLQAVTGIYWQREMSAHPTQMALHLTHCQLKRRVRVAAHCQEPELICQQLLSHPMRLQCLPHRSACCGMQQQIWRHHPQLLKVNFSAGTRAAWQGGLQYSSVGLTGPLACSTVV